MISAATTTPLVHTHVTLGTRYRFEEGPHFGYHVRVHAVDDSTDPLLVARPWYCGGYNSEADSRTHYKQEIDFRPSRLDSSGP